MQIEYTPMPISCAPSISQKRLESSRMLWEIEPMAANSNSPSEPSPSNFSS